MNGVKNWWSGFVDKHPAAAKWIREGGLFLVFCYVVTGIKAILLIFLPAFYHNFVGDQEWLWPGVPVTLFGVDFKLSIIGNALEVDQLTGAFKVNSGLAFTLANLTTIFFGECINFPLQRNVTFKSKGPVVPQIVCHFLATAVVFLVVNLFTCVWNPLTGVIIQNEAVRNIISAIVTTVVTGGVSMAIIFIVDKTIFAPGWGERNLRSDKA